MNCPFKSSDFPLCLALQRSAPKSVIEQLLDMGCSIYGCAKHGGSVLHCAVSSLSCHLKQNVFELLIERGADVAALNEKRQTVLCFALQNGYDASTVQLIVNAGAPLNRCPHHHSALYCATNCYKGGTLKADTMDLILRSGATLDPSFPNTLTPLICALRICTYESKAIEFLLDSTPTLSSVEMSSCLRTAVHNNYCTSDVVKHLIKKKAEVNEVNEMGDSALHLALKNQDCRVNVIKALIEKGAELNKENFNRQTPLLLAIKNKPPDPCITDELLAAGAFINFCMCEELLRIFFLFEPLPFIKMLLRYFFLQTSHIDFECKFQLGQSSATLLKFRDECKQELEKMKLVKIGEQLTLYELLSEYSSPRDTAMSCYELPAKEFKFENLLKAIGGNSYPQYLNVIASKIGMKNMKKILDEVQVYCSTSVEKVIVLNYESVCHIARFTTNVDLMNLILAYYNPYNNPCMGQSSNEKMDMSKRNANFAKCV